MLMAKEYMISLLEECSVLLADAPTYEETRAYNTWRKPDQMAQCFTLALCPMCCKHGMSHLPQATTS